MTSWVVQYELLVLHFLFLKPVSPHTFNILQYLCKHRNYKLQHTYIFLCLASCDLTEEARRSEMKSRSRSQNPPTRVVTLHPQLREQSHTATLRQRWETTEKTGRQSRVDTKMRPSDARISKAAVAVKDTAELPQLLNSSQNLSDVVGVSVDNRVPALARPNACDVRHQIHSSSDGLQKKTERILPQDESCYLSNNSAPTLKLSLFTKIFPDINSEQHMMINHKGGHLGKESRKTGSSPSQLMQMSQQQPGGGPCWFRPSNSPEVRKRSSR
jgi:hypothetical protein